MASEMNDPDAEKEGMKTQDLELILRNFSSRKKNLRVQILGVFPSDLIPFSQLLSNSRETSLGCIVNTDPSSQPGEHWVAFYRNCQNESPLEFFDSFGQSPITYGLFQENSKFPKNLEISFNNTILQSLTTNVCGQYCLLFLRLRMKSESPSSFATVIDKLLSLAPNSKLRDMFVAKFISALSHSHLARPSKLPRLTRSSANLLVPLDSSESAATTYLIPSSFSQISRRPSFLFSSQSKESE